MGSGLYIGVVYYIVAILRTSLQVIDFKMKTIGYYDSMGGQNNACLNALGAYLRDESMDKKKQEYKLDGWNLVTVKVRYNLRISLC